MLITQFDKNTIEDLGLIKIDLLSLRTLAAVSDVEQILKPRGFSYDRIPHDDPQTYARLRTGETVGVFQLESPAQRSLQSRLGSEAFEDLVASVALIRPGPIKEIWWNLYCPAAGLGGSHLYPPQTAKNLGKDLWRGSLPEQVIEIATEIAGSPQESQTAAESNDSLPLSQGNGEHRRRVYRQAVANGVEREVAEVISPTSGYAAMASVRPMQLLCRYSLPHSISFRTPPAQFYLPSQSAAHGVLPPTRSASKLGSED